MIVVFYPPMLKPFAWLTGQAPWEQGLTDAVAEGSPTRQLTLTLLGLFAIGRLAFRRKDQPVRVGSNVLGWLLIAFAALALASVLWSDEPVLSFRRLVALAMIGLAAFAYRRMPGEEFLRLVFFTTLAALAFVLVKEVARGAFHPWDPTYRFGAEYSNANILGWTCALAVFSGLALLQGLRRWRLAAALVLLLACLLLTRSRTSLAAFLGAALFYVLLSLLRKRPSVVVASLCLAAAAVVSVVWIEQVSPWIENAVKLGREESGIATFQGRTNIWEEATPYVRARPWLGYGYAVFWTVDRMEEFSRTLGWMNQNGHSNYLDVLLGLGYIGLCVFVCILGIGMWRASKVAVGSGNPGDLFTATLLVFCALHGFFETTLVGPCFLTFLYMTAVVRLGFPPDAPVGNGRVR